MITPEFSMTPDILRTLAADACERYGRVSQEAASLIKDPRTTDGEKGLLSRLIETCSNAGAFLADAVVSPSDLEGYDRGAAELSITLIDEFSDSLAAMRSEIEAST